jgi:uncharacterized protein
MRGLRAYLVRSENVREVALRIGTQQYRVWTLACQVFLCGGKRSLLLFWSRIDLRLRAAVLYTPTSALVLLSPPRRSTVSLLFAMLLLLSVGGQRVGAQNSSRNLSPVPVASEAASSGGYYALVIGINVYPKPITSLNTPVHDAEEIARVLRDRYGFQVRLLRNGEATREKILGAITSYESSLRENDNLLIYYAGHGFRNPKANESYWLPSNADSSQSSNRISADDLTAEIASMRASHVLVISDSCYSGGLTRDINDPLLSHGQDAFLRKMLLNRSRTLMASGRDEPVADGGPDGHSIFAYAVLKALEDERQAMFTASDLFYGGVQRRVAGNSDQVPQYTPIRHSGDEAGDFVFKRVGVTTVEKQNQLAAPAAGFDRGLALYRNSEYRGAAEIAKPACESGDSRACTLLGEMYEHGQGLATDRAQATTLYRKACDSGDADGCTGLGVMYETAEGAATNFNQVIPLFRKGCEGGNALGCSKLGHLYLFLRDDAQALVLLRKGCDGGDAGGCTDLGIMYEYGRGVDADLAQAVTLYRKGCDGGQVVVCLDLGVMYETGKGVAADLTQAAAFFRKGCDGGDAKSCSNLGTMYEDGKGVAADLTQAIALFRKGCDGGDANGCSNLGAMYENGKGVAADLTQAVALSRKGCDGGDAFGCTLLGYTYETGKGVATDLAKAADLYLNGCRGGNALACSNLGTLYEGGRGVRADPEEAVFFYRQSCDLGDPHGCRNLGALYESGRGVPADLAQAATFYRKACDSGDAKGCLHLAIMCEKGKGVKKDKNQAASEYRKACDLGEQEACTKLKALQP